MVQEVLLWTFETPLPTTRLNLSEPMHSRDRRVWAPIRARIGCVGPPIRKPFEMSRPGQPCTLDKFEAQRTRSSERQDEGDHVWGSPGLGRYVVEEGGRDLRTSSVGKVVLCCKIVAGVNDGGSTRPG